MRARMTAWRRAGVRRTAVAAGAVAALLMAGRPAAGQGAVGPDRERAGLGAGVALESYRFAEPARTGIESLMLLSMPFGARAPLLGRSSLEATGAWARARLVHADGRATTLAGPTDTELRLRVPFGRDAATLHGVVVLPTGVERMGEAEAEVAGAIAADLLPFRITHWGAGGGAGLGATYATTLGGFGVGAGASFIIGREFEPVDADSFAYRPGDTYRINIAVDRTLGLRSKAALQVAFQHHGDDAVNGTNLYRAGRRWQAIASYAFAAGANGAAATYAGVMHRGSGTPLTGIALETPAQDLFIAGAAARFAVRGGVLLPAVDARVFRSDDGVGQGWVATAGAAGEWPLGGITAVPSLRARVGHVTVRQGRESGITGVELGLALRLGERVR